MDRGRVKTFVLCLLLAVNLTFLGILLADRAQTTRLDQTARAALIQTLEHMGFTMELDAIPDTQDQVLYRLIRNTGTETQVVNAILGNAIRTEEGGGIYHYASPLGHAQFHTGSFRFQFSVPIDPDPLFDFMQLTAREPVWAYDMLVYPLTIDNLPIFNGLIVFHIPDNQVQTITGPPLWGTPHRYSPDPLQDATTALVQLAGHLRDWSPATRFEHVEMGYFLTEGIGYLELRPVWIVTTDRGTFSVDRQSGVVR